jgi:hypothetical protein
MFAPLVTTLLRRSVAATGPVAQGLADNTAYHPAPRPSLRRAAYRAPPGQRPARTMARAKRAERAPGT